MISYPHPDSRSELRPIYKDMTDKQKVADGQIKLVMQQLNNLFESMESTGAVAQQGTYQMAKGELKKSMFSLSLSVREVCND